MERTERFSVESLIEKRTRGSSSSEADKYDQNNSDPDEESAQETRHSVTSFSVRDILDPHKFNTHKGTSSDSDSERDYPEMESDQADVWHPWKEAARYSCPQKKAHGELLSFPLLREDSRFFRTSLKLYGVARINRFISFNSRVFVTRTGLSVIIHTP